MINKIRNSATLIFFLILTFIAIPAAGQAVLDSVTPTAQRVHEIVTLRGHGFGAYEHGVSQVVFAAAAARGGATATGMPYVWRDDFIQIRVPVHVPATALTISITTADGESNLLSFTRRAVAGASVDFYQKSRIANNFDTSGFLGRQSTNTARTKDGEVGDVDGDGFVDLLDNNSNNQSNGTFGVLRRNNAGLFFRPRRWEPVTPLDSGDFAVTVLPGGSYSGDTVAYDADLVDLNNDGLPDWAQAASQDAAGVRIAINNYQGVAGNFVEATSVWLPSPAFPSGSADDLAHADVNFDGFVDLAAAFRFSRTGQVYINDNGSSFGQTIDINSIASASVHDIFFLDANADGLPDITLVNESGITVVAFHDGDIANPSWSSGTALNFAAYAGIDGDFNGDGFADIALSGFGESAVFMNDPLNPGNFTETTLPGGTSFMYDMEPGDIDLDGDLDLIAAIVETTPGNSIRIWLNDGAGNFTNLSDPDARVVLPGIGNYQRLSADLFDYDNDGDLDLSITGGDGSGPFGFGGVANQFWENRILGLSVAAGGVCPGAVNLQVKGATPNGTLALLRGAQGLNTLPDGPCAGTTVGVTPQVLGMLQADANGEFSAQPALPAQSCNRWIEVVDLASCEVSSVERLPVAAGVSD